MSTQARTFSRSRVRDLAGAMLVVVLTILIFLGWFESTVLLGVALAAQLAIGGSLGIALLGPARADNGVARYLTLPLTAIGITLFGRFFRPTELLIAILLAVVAAAVLWAALQIELAYSRGQRPKVLLDLLLATVIFCGSASIGSVIGEGMPVVILALLGLLALALSLRAAEARGASGGTALGHAFLQAFTVVQLAVALELLELPGVIGPAVMLLAFYVWGGAADLLHEGASRRRVFVEYGFMALIGLVVALLAYRWGA